MRRFDAFLWMLLILSAGATHGQNKINGYARWFDNNADATLFTAVTPTEILELSAGIETDDLEPGIHTVHFCFRDEHSRFSPVLSRFFFKPEIQQIQNKEMSACQYWMDGFFSNAVTAAIGGESIYTLQDNIDVNNLYEGIHAIHLRFRDNTGAWSSILSRFFYFKKASQVTLHEIVAYQYWLDDDYAGAYSQSAVAGQQFILFENIDLSSLPAGLHLINVRFKDNSGLWSSVSSQFVMKLYETFEPGNEMVRCRYWLDDDFASAESLEFEPTTNLVDMTGYLDFTQVWKGEHTLHFQHQDARGSWSAVTTDTITKLSLPIADFDYTPVVFCDSTVIETSNNSIDGDVYLWDFGDGTISNEPEPVHVYSVPGDYAISLTVTDTLLGIDSTLVKPVTVAAGTSYSSIDPVACDSYLSPGNTYTWNVSGIYTDTILNVLGCDSIITVNLTILNSTTSTITQVACDTFTSPSGNFTWTTSGIYHDTIPNSAGCDSVITINLTVVEVDTSVTNMDPVLVSNAENANYQWLDCENMQTIPGATGQSYTATTNGSFAVVVTQDGCTDTSACIPVISVGIKELVFGDDFSVFPNPTNGSITIDFGKLYPEMMIFVRDLQGRVVLNQLLRNTEGTALEIVGPPGQYLVDILTNKGDKTILKVVKK